MNKRMHFVFFMIFFLSALRTLAVKAPDLGVVDQYIQFALKTETASLRGKGQATCSYRTSNNLLGPDIEKEAFGKNLNEASQRLALLCIKERCPNLGKYISIGLHQFDQVNTVDNTEFLKAQGLSDGEIALVFKNQKQMSRSPIEAITCETATPNGRAYIFDSCFANPMSCH